MFEENKKNFPSLRESIVYNMFPKTLFKDSNVETIGILWTYLPDGMVCFSSDYDKISKKNFIISVTPKMPFSELWGMFRYIDKYPYEKYVEKINKLWVKKFS